MFFLRNDRTESCYCRNGKVTPDPVPIFHKFLTPGRIRHRKKNAESCRFRPNLCLALLLFGSVNDEPYWILLEMARAAMVRVLGGPQRLNERGGDDIFSVWTSPSRPLLLKKPLKFC